MGLWKMWSVENEDCGKLGLENVECGKWGVKKIRIVENEECGKRGVLACVAGDII